MKKLWILSALLLSAIACSDDGDDDDVVITTLTGTQFTLSEFKEHTFPATDSWTITDSTADAEDFEGLSAAIEYITWNYDRAISIEFSNLASIPSYAIFGSEITDNGRKFAALASVSAPAATSVGDYAFDSCSGITSIDMDGVQSVGIAAFRHCSSLASVGDLQPSEVSTAAFYGCKALTEIDLSQLTTIESQAFYYCESLTDVSLPQVTEIKDGAFAYCPAVESVDAPLATTIGELAFADCELLTSLNIPVAETIGDKAFTACNSLTSFTIPAGVASIDDLGVGTLNNCAALTTIDTSANSNFIFEDGILYDATKSIVVGALSAVVSGDLLLDSSVVELRKRAFSYCSNITSVELSSIVEVSDAAFAYCHSIDAVSLSAATTLKIEAFYDCSLMTTFDAPYLTTIECDAFYNCDSLTDLSMATATGVILLSIDSFAFHNMPADEVTVTVGAANADLVTYGDTITVGDFSVEFDTVTVLEE